MKMGERSDQSDLHWENKLAELESLVVAGEHDACRNQLDSFLPIHISRELAPKLAELATRVHHSIFAMKVLYQYIFPEFPSSLPATAHEKSVYANALLNLGAASEAIELLETVDSVAVPEVLIQKSLAHFKDWNYSKSIPLLETFTTAPNVLPYRKVVGQVNLSAAYICLSRWSEATEVLHAVEKQCVASGYHLLLGNCYELQAQVQFFQKNYDAAISFLEKSIELLKNQKGLYLIFVEKWMTICRCFQSPTPENMQRLHEVRGKANLEYRWETVRECDLFESILNQDQALIHKVMMGTPSESYRERARKLFGKTPRRNGPYLFLIAGTDTPANPRVFNPYQAGPKGERLSEKAYLLALFGALTLDFYKPSYLGSLFKVLYPDEKFNPETSPARVLQLLKRLDLWFQQYDWPLYVHFKKSEFSIKSRESIAITVQRGKEITDFEIKQTEVKKAFAGRTFTAHQLSAALGLSKTTTNQTIKRLLAEGSLISGGKGRGIFYQFTTRKAAKLAG